jgi:transposase-like protein
VRWYLRFQLSFRDLVEMAAERGLPLAHTRRDVAAAKAFLRKALKRQRSAPRSITLDGYAASHRAVREMKTAGELPEAVKRRSSRY